MKNDNKDNLRSKDWFGKTGKDGFIYRSWLKNQGYPSHQFKGKPVLVFAIHGQKQLLVTDILEKSLSS